MNEHEAIATDLDNWAGLARASADRNYEEFQRLAKERKDEDASNCERAYDVESIQADVLWAVAKHIRNQGAAAAKRDDEARQPQRVSYGEIRPNILRAIRNYADHHLPTGDFLQAVLENKLLEAFELADDDNLRALFHICAYVYNEIPGNCHGSPERVKAWLANRPTVERADGCKG